MTITGSLGPFIDRSTVERQTLKHVQTWLPFYLARVEAAKSLEPHTLVVPKSWDISVEFTRRPEDTLPLVAVVSPGLAGEMPVRDGDGTVRAWWSVAIGVVVSASSEQASKDLSGYYAAAVRLLMLQRSDLGGWANDAQWVDERYDDLPTVDERTLAAARLVFAVEVADVADAFAGFTGELSDPYESPSAEPTVVEGGAQYEVEIK